MMRMKTPIAIVAALITAGCAGGPLTTRERATLGGAVLGAGTGAIVGRAVGKPGTGALIGAGVGTVAGAVVGDMVQGASAPPPPPPPPPAALPAPAPPVVAPVVSHGATDPTRGVFVNGTPWRVTVEVNGSPFVLMPGEARPGGLDIGVHRVRARGEVDTQFGPRTVGWSEHAVTVDPRASGWSVHFGRWDFR
jgi:hypothetical protein